jgi:hypothetical protein
MIGLSAAVQLPDLVVTSVTGHDQWCSWIKLPTSDGIGKNSLAMLPDTA